MLTPKNGYTSSQEDGLFSGKPLFFPAEQWEGPLLQAFPLTMDARYRTVPAKVDRRN
jgi:hypothetical protein